MLSKDNIINLVPVITAKNKTRHCQCKHPRYEIDPVNREVRCLECGNFVDPIDALMELSNNWERILDWENRQKEIVRQLSKYKPWKKALKNIEQHIGRKGEYLPVCPHCKKGIRLEEMNGFIHESICENKGWEHKKEPN